MFGMKDCKQTMLNPENLNLGNFAAWAVGCQSPRSKGGPALTHVRRPGISTAPSSALHGYMMPGTAGALLQLRDSRASR
jgi:hypothetical protein